MDSVRIIEIKESVFADNDREADRVRAKLKEEKTFLLNLMSSPGSGKTTTLLRTIEDLALPNLGINLDTANIILYGKGNPLDSLDVFGKYVRNLHVKDGVYPVDGHKLGHEVAIGKGKVDFKKIIPKLHELGFKGELVIEREISGEQQAKDIMASLKYIGGLVDKL